MPIIAENVHWQDLPLVKIRLQHNNNTDTFRFAIDTGANKTLARTYVAEMLVFDLRKVTTKAIVTTGTKNESAYRITIDALELESFAAANIPIYFKSLPSGIAYIDGLLGLDFFQTVSKKLCFDFKNNEISLG